MEVGIDLQEIASWCEQRASELSASDATLECRLPTTALPKNSVTIDVETEAHLARVSIWESGECDLEALDISSGATVLMEHHELPDTRAALARVDGFIDWVASGAS